MSDSGENDRLLPAIPYIPDYGEENTLLDADDMSGDQVKVGISTQELVTNEGYGPGNKLPQYVAALSATIGALAAGTLLGWTSPTQKRIVDDGELGFPVTKDEFGWIGSLVTLGAAFICIPIGILMDKIGRKVTMLLLVVPFTLGWALVIWAQNVPMIYAGRFIVGMAGGAFCVTAPVYTGEIAQKEIRGMLGSFFQAMLTVGILFVYAVGSGTNVFVLSLICGVIPLVFGVVFFLMPETPMYEVSRANITEARKSLVRLRGNDYDIDGELETLQHEHELAIANPVPIREAFSTRAAKRALFISFGLMIFQQLSGINAVIFYTADIFESAGSSLDKDISSIIVGVMQVVATVVASLIVDKLGRRILLLISDFVMTICCILLGVFFYLKEETETDQATIDSISWLPLVSLCLFIVAFSLGFGPIPWMILGELFPPNIKGTASSLAGVFNWLLAFLVTKTFDPMITSIGPGGTYWIFAGVSCVGTVFVFFCVPETKGKTLQEIQTMLGGLPPKENTVPNNQQ